MRGRALVTILCVLSFCPAVLCAPEAPQQRRALPSPAAKGKPQPKVPASRSSREENPVLKLIQQSFDRAQQAEKEGDLIRAESEYRQALGIGLEQLGALYNSLDELDRAAAAYTAASEARANSSNALLGLGMVSFRQGRYEKGAEAVNLLIAQQRVNPVARSLLGKLYIGMEKYDAAVQELEEAQRWQPDDQEIKFSLASAYLRQKRPEKAEAIFSAMLKQFGDSPQLHIFFGVFCFENDYFEKAVSELRRAAALDPGYPRVHYYLGLALVSQEGRREIEPAIKEFNEELARRPKDYLAHYMLGLVLIQERRYKEAAEHLQKAQGIEPSKPDPELFLGQALFLSDQQAAAIPHLQKAIELTTDPSRNNFQVSKAHYMLGQYLNRHGKGDEAQKHMDLASEYKVKAAALDQEKVRAIMGGTGGPNDIKVQAASETPSVFTSRNDLTPAERSKLKDAEKVYTHIAATAYNRLGLLRAGQSDFRRAAQLLSRAVQWQPDIPNLQFNLGLACYKAQNYVEAIAPLLKAREQEPLRTDVQVLLGLSYFYAEQYREAGRVLTSLAAAGNEDPQVLYALGLCHAYAGDREMGKRILQNLAEKYPAVADTHVALGRAFALDANYSAAAAEFSRALEIDPRLAEVHYHKGLTLVRQKRNAEAADEFRQELQLNPTHAKAAYHLGFCLSSLDQLDEALTYLNTALRLNPGYVDAHYEMGKVQIRKGATAEAIASLQKAAELGGERSYIQYQLSQALLRAGRNEEAQAALARYREYKAKEQAARGAARGEPETK